MVKLKKSQRQSLLMWMIIASAVLAVAVLILLFFGYLLQDNQSKNQQYQTQQAQIASATFDTVEQAKLQETDGTTAVEKILLEHLVCQRDDQCTVVNSFQQDLGCYIAINRIGATQIKRLSREQLVMDSACFDAKQPAFAHCQDNLCQLSARYQQP
jgi:cytoskeletal protein RodZ